MASQPDLAPTPALSSPISKRSVKSLKLTLTPASSMPSISFERLSLRPTVTLPHLLSPTLPAPHQLGALSVRSDVSGLYPDWLENRKDFQELRNRYDKLSAIDVYQVCQKSPLLRNDFDRRAIVRFIKLCPFFSTMKTDQLLDLSDKMQSVFFASGQALIGNGDQADCLYVIYSGKVGIYIEGDRCIEEVIQGNVVGESAIQSRCVRSATVKAHGDVTTLKLTYDDFDNVAYKQKLQDFYNVADFLATLGYFSGWNRGKLYRLASVMIVKQYQAEQFVYHRGDAAHDLYIVREGAVHLKIDIDLEHTNRWPTGNRQWLCVSTIKKYEKTLRECHVGDFFGERELIDSSPLSATAQCVSLTALLFIIRQEFFAEIFSDKDKKLLYHLSDNRPLTKELRFQVEFEKLQAKIRAAAFLNAINTNCVPGGRELFQTKRDLRRVELARRVVKKQRMEERRGIVGQMKKVETKTDRSDTLCRVNYCV